MVESNLIVSKVKIGEDGGCSKLLTNLLNARAEDSRPRGHGFESHQRRMKDVVR